MRVKRGEANVHLFIFLRSYPPSASTGTALPQDSPRADVKTQTKKSVSVRSAVSVPVKSTSREEPVSDLRNIIQTTSSSQGTKKRRKLRR